MEEGSCQIQGFKYNRKTQERQSSGGLMVNSSGGLWALREWQVKKVLPKGISEGCEDLSCTCTLSQSAEDPFSCLRCLANCPVPRQDGRKDMFLFT